MKLLLLAILVCLNIGLVGCKEYGTEGGNPQSSDASEIVDTAVAVVKELCAKRNSCLHISDSSCASALLSQVEITNELRMNPPYRNLQELLIGAYDGKVLVDIAKSDTCSAAIKNLDCADPQVSVIFDPTNFDDVHLGLRSSPSCADVYRINP